MRIGILTSGGDCPGINATIRGVCKTAINYYGMEVIGIHSGFQGLLTKDVESITDKSLSGLLNLGGTMLGTSREKPFKKGGVVSDVDKPSLILQNIREMELDCVVCIGGNGTQKTAAKFAAMGVNIVSVPKTIDNDLMGTDHTPGFGSAAKYVAASILEVVHDSLIYQLQSVTIIEIMGRNAGWLTAAAALARNEYNVAPDLIYLPEVVFDKDKFLADIHEVMKRKRCVVIAVSEGIRDQNGHFLDDDSKYAKKDAFGHVLHSGTGKLLESLVFKEFGCKVRSIELNVLQRCAMHIASKTDLNESFVIGSKAIDKALENVSGHVMGFKRLSNHPYEIDYISTDVREVANYEQKIPVEWINEEGNDITQELYEYLYPLIQGEVHVTYKDGIPSYYSCKHLEK